MAADYTFLFEDGAETVGVTIDAGLLAGARASEKEVMIRGDVPEGEWVAGAYRAQVLDPAQDRFYDDLLASFREVRDRRGLDGDRYLELMAAAVQQLPYVSAPGTAAKYPVETWADRSGDCDDKTLLLAGLLAREGYRVALLVFLPESHMALGVGCPAGYDYGGSGYAYLEVTNGSYVGTVPDRIGDGVRLASAPLVVPIGNGTTGFGAAPETATIEAARRTARARVDALAPEIDRRRAGLETDRRRLEAPRLGRRPCCVRGRARTVRRGQRRVRPARRGVQPGGGPPEPDRGVPVRPGRGGGLRLGAPAVAGRAGREPGEEAGRCGRRGGRTDQLAAAAARSGIGPRARRCGRMSLGPCRRGRGDVMITCTMAG